MTIPAIASPEPVLFKETDDETSRPRVRVDAKSDDLLRRDRVRVDGVGASNPPVAPAPRASGPPPAATARARGPLVYVKHAIVHPWHVVVLAGATVCGVANWSAALLCLVFVLSEAALLTVLLHLPAFRRHVDERLAQLERARAAEERAALLLQMSDDHRRELLRLEAVVDRIREGARRHGELAQGAVDECLRLLANYVRLAIAYDVGRDCLTSVDRRSLDDTVRALESARPSESEAVQRLASRRVAIARKRAARWDRSRDALEAIAHQLAMIAELVHLTYEQVVAPADCAGVGVDIERASGELEEHQATLEELSEWLGVEETIDPRSLDIGRVRTS